MELTAPVFAFVVALAAVVNGLGIVRLIGGLGDYLRSRHRLQVHSYWVYFAVVLFQLLAHALLWWSLLGLRSAGTINFLSYLYLILGPTLLFLATSLMIPDADGDSIDTREAYYRARKVFYSIMLAFWIWGILVWPVFGYPFAPTVPFLLVFAIVSLVLRLTDRHAIHAAGVILMYLVFSVVVGRYAMELGKVGRMMTGTE